MGIRKFHPRSFGSRTGRVLRESTLSARFMPFIIFRK
jgi:hypothetical protein